MQPEIAIQTALVNIADKPLRLCALPRGLSALDGLHLGRRRVLRLLLPSRPLAPLYRLHLRGAQHPLRRGHSDGSVSGRAAVARTLATEASSVATAAPADCFAVLGLLLALGGRRVADCGRNDVFCGACFMGLFKRVNANWTGSLGLSAASSSTSLSIAVRFIWTAGHRFITSSMIAMVSADTGTGSG